MAATTQSRPVTATPSTSPPKPAGSTGARARRVLRQAADRYALTAVAAVAVVWVALEGGGYGEVTRHAAGALAWACAFGLFLVRGRAALPRGPALVVATAIAVFAALTGLSIIWSESAGRSYDELTRGLSYLGFFLAATGAVTGSARRRDQLVEGLTIGMAAVVGIAVLSRLEPWLFADQNLDALPPEFRPRLAYPLGYWNAVGSFVAITIPLLVHAASRADRSVHYNAGATALLPVAGLALYLTFSRGALVAAAVAVGLILALSPRRGHAFGAVLIGAVGAAVVIPLVRSYSALSDGLIEQADARSQGHRVLAALVVVGALAYAARVAGERSGLISRLAATIAAHRRKLGIAGIVLVIAGSAVAAPRVADRLDDFENPSVLPAGPVAASAESRLASGSANGRAQYWRASIDAWQTRPVAGRGAGTWEFWWRRNATIVAPARDSHSLAFDVVAELGTLGVLSLMAMIGSALWFCFAVARRATAAQRPALVAVAGAAVAWAIGVAIDWSWEFALLGGIFFALAAAAAAARLDERPETRPAGRARRARTPLVAAAALGASIMALVQGTALAAAWSLERSQSAVVREDLEAAESAAERARKLEPWAAEPWIQLSTVRVRIDSAATDGIDAAREAVEREPTNWRTWLVLTRVEARSGRLGDAARHNARVAELAKGSPIVPSYEELQRLSTSEDLSLSP